jgi:uncharacterized membrane protein YfcA
MELVVVVLGALAGLVTTVAGLGGGVLLVLALSLVMPPSAALAVTTPALFLGNAHRAAMFRRAIDRDAVARFGVVALPASLAGGLFLHALPELALRLVLAAVAALSIVQLVAKLELRFSRAYLPPVGLGVGLLTGASGGAGVLVSPTLLGVGLTGEAFVATAAAASVVMHVGRSIAYGASGLYDARALTLAGLLAAGVLLGNLAGRRARRLVPEGREKRLELGVLTVVATLAALGLGR